MNFLYVHPLFLEVSSPEHNISVLQLSQSAQIKHLDLDEVKAPDFQITSLDLFPCHYWSSLHPQHNSPFIQCLRDQYQNTQKNKKG